MTRGDYYELYDSNPSQNGRISFTCTYRLYRITHYPGAVPSSQPDEWVFGDVFDLNDLDLLAALDRAARASGVTRSEKIAEAIRASLKV